MENSYKISCIIPIYNVAEFLEDCVLSVVHQTQDGIEIILMDDGSTDGSSAIGEELAGRFENVFYYHKENGGLGQARNVAVPHAHGEYIIFLDSDDIVPADAYEKMYRKAKETGVNMVIGGVRRFNSKGEWASDLQKKAILRSNDRTSILESPELIYDTTSWNKLIRREFYLAHNFQFPEHILYEDIPVTIPMHHLANGVAVIEDTVYLWRLREGASKSITQDRTAIPNFADRVTVMRMLDDFYAKHVTDETAIFRKDYKWLETDLHLYVQQFVNATDEYIDYAMNEIRTFLAGMNPNVFAAIPAIERQKYELIRENKKEELLALLDYEKNGYWMVKSKKCHENGAIHYYMNKKFGNFPKEYYDLTQDFNVIPVSQKINSNRWIGDTYEVRGFCLLKRQANLIPGRMKLSAELLNVNTNAKVSLPIQNVSAKGVRGLYGFGVNRANYHFSYTSYFGSGYRVSVDFARADVQEILGGDLKIHIVMTYGGITRDFYVQTPQIIDKKYVAEKNLPAYREVKGSSICTYYGASYGLIFRTKKNLAELEHAEIADEKLILTAKDGAKAELPVAEITEKMYPEIAGRRVTSNERRWAKVLPSGKKLIKVMCGEDGILAAEEIPCGPILTKLTRTDSGKLNFHVNIPAAMISKEIKAEHLALKFTGKSTKRASKELELVQIGEEYEAVLDLSDKEMAQSFCVDNWLGTVLGKNGEETVFSLPLTGDSAALPATFSLDGYTYEFLKESQLNIRTTLHWHWYENSWRRRLVLKKVVFRVFRKVLPIHKNRMVFESYWGGQFSCNPRGFYEFMQKEHPEYTCIWSFVDERTPMTGNAIRIRRESLKYQYYMATSHYFMDNVNFDGEFIKRKGQVVFQTMHGTPMKTLGLDVPGDFPTEKSREAYIKRCKRWDYLIVQSDRVAEITKKCFLFDRTFLRTGYPRNDRIITENTPEKILELKKKMGLPLDKKIVLYAPTWRRKNHFRFMIDPEKLEEMTGEKIEFLIRLHPFSAAGLNESELGTHIRNMTNYPSVEDLYLVADLLITDYSSVMFDYGVLDKPMFFYAFDLADYRDALRGFYFDFDKEVPGPIYQTSDELIDGLVHMDEVNEKYGEKRELFKKNFCEYEDGTACKRIFEQAFK